MLDYTSIMFARATAEDAATLLDLEKRVAVRGSGPSARLGATWIAPPIAGSAMAYVIDVNLRRRH